MEKKGFVLGLRFIDVKLEESVVAFLAVKESSRGEVS